MGEHGQCQALSHCTAGKAGVGTAALLPAVRHSLILG